MSHAIGWGSRKELPPVKRCRKKKDAVAIDIADRLEKLLDVALATLKRGDAVGAMLVLAQASEEADQIINKKEKRR